MATPPSNTDDRLAGQHVSSPSRSIQEEGSVLASSVAQSVEVNDNDNDTDADFALGSDSSSEYSTSLASSVRNYTYENGRRYHAYRAGEYPIPNDEAEQDRLDLGHHNFKLLIGGALYRAPITGTPDRPQPGPQRVIDVGTGTGLWAIEIADEFPEAEVIGTDLSPIQPEFVPPNCRFYVDDMEDEWASFGRQDALFDYIHGRALAGGIKDWARLYQQMYTHLKPGGWVEMQEYNGDIYPNDKKSEESAVWIKQWCEDLDVATTRFGKRLNVADYHKEWMQQAGFVDVQDDIYKVPLGSWAKDPKLKNMGCYQRAQMLDSIEPFSLRLYTGLLGKTLDETQVCVRKETKALTRTRFGFGLAGLFEVVNKWHS